MGIVDMTTNSNSMGNPFLRLMFSAPDPAASPTLQDLAHLRLDSTLADLPNYDFRVDGTTTGRLVAAEFEKRPDVPGVIVLNDDQILGVFSRRQFLEQVVRPYGAEVYLNRPIHVMVDNLSPTHLAFPSGYTIHKAASATMQRSRGLFDQPIVVAFPDGRLRLLDVYTLILAQSHLLNEVYRIEQNRRQFAESLQTIGRELSSSLSLPKVTKRILKELDKVVEYERGLVMLQKDLMLHTIAKRGFPPDIKKTDLSIPIRPTNDDVFRRIVQTSQPVYIPDVTADGAWTQRPDLTLNHSWLGVPLLVQERVIGMISLTRIERNAFHEDDITLVEAFANQAAVALENARLYDEISLLNEHLEEKVTQRTEELNQAYSILERLDKNKSDFINVSAHELRTPLTVISGYAQMLRLNPAVSKEANASMMAEGIANGVERLQRIVNNMLDVARIDSNTLQINHEAVNVKTILDKLSLEFAGSIAERRQTLYTEGFPEEVVVSGDAELLKKVLYALIINAIKYTPDGGHITVTGRVQAAEGTAEIMVSDTGVGIAHTHHELIFEKFFQTGEVALHSSGLTKFKGGGPGLGLAIAKGIVLAHEGEIWVESPGYNETTCPGSDFFIRLPLFKG